MSDADVFHRDGYHCVACDGDLTRLPAAAHHRILGNRKDNRASNKIAVCGRGNTELCHGEIHAKAREAAWAGYRVSRHIARSFTRSHPVYYNQPSLGRVGWFLLDDDYQVIPCNERGEAVL